MKNEVFARRVYQLQNKIVRELNDAHIFLKQIEPLLEEARRPYRRSRSKTDRKYYVPSTKKSKVARRTDAELVSIYDHYQNSGLFEAFLVNAVARFEWFLADLLVEFFSRYPLRITENFQGIPSTGKIEVTTVLDSSGKDELVRRIVSDHVGGVFRQRPSSYMAYLVRMLGLNEDPIFQDFYEIAATRDLVVHNGRIANELYQQKAGQKARAALGESVTVDDRYFARSIATLKRVSGAIKRDVETHFGAAPKVKPKEASKRTGRAPR